MNKPQAIARTLISLGCLVVVVGSILHLIAGYANVSAALATSNLDEGLRDAMGAVFLMIGLSWIALAVDSGAGIPFQLTDSEQFSR
ncbi:MAG TPA: hypothetical protein VHU83_10455 [Bryobacteraceae bacterium]|jgi:hypothetical protein|nr:hypothetical protein [Bryobacteraceae bacterium]